VPHTFATALCRPNRGWEGRGCACKARIKSDSCSRLAPLAAARQLLILKGAARGVSCRPPESPIRPINNSAVAEIPANQLTRRHWRSVPQSDEQPLEWALCCRTALICCLIGAIPKSDIDPDQRMLAASATEKFRSILRRFGFAKPSQLNLAAGTRLGLSRRSLRSLPRSDREMPIRPRPVPPLRRGCRHSPWRGRARHRPPSAELWGSSPGC
jgi:hypothetical protein